MLDFAPTPLVSSIFHMRLSPPADRWLSQKRRARFKSPWNLLSEEMNIYTCILDLKQSLREPKVKENEKVNIVMSVIIGISSKSTLNIIDKCVDLLIESEK